MRAQSGIELVALFSIALAFFSLLYLYLGSESQRVRDSHGAFEARTLARSIAALVTLAGSSTGYYHEFTLPGLVSGRSYNLTITNDSVWVDWSRGSFLAEARADSVRNATSFAPLALPPGNYYVNNTAGTVWVMAK